MVYNLPEDPLVPAENPALVPGSAGNFRQAAGPAKMHVFGHSQPAGCTGPGWYDL